MRVRCPHCKAWANARSTEQMSATAKRGWYACTNVECGHTFTVWITAAETLSPSAMPDPTVMLPMSRYVRRDQLASQLAKAPTADYEPQGQTSDGCHAADLFGGNTPIPKAAKPT